MENQENNNAEQEIVGIIRELLQKMGFEAEVSVRKTQNADDTITCDIKTTESSFLIGQFGVNLHSLQHIARLLVRKKLEKANFILDVNSYRQEKSESIVNMAKNLAQQCLAEKRAVTLRPMSSYERRIVHLELSKNDQVKTESIGEGENRRIVIKPADSL